jgi:hypothetical protein
MSVIRSIATPRRKRPIAAICDGSAARACGVRSAGGRRFPSVRNQVRRSVSGAGRLCGQSCGSLVIYLPRAFDM